MKSKLHRVRVAMKIMLHDIRVALAKLLLRDVWFTITIVDQTQKRTVYGITGGNIGLAPDGQVWIKPQSRRGRYMDVA